jgi:hypothetical protein
MVGRMPRMQVYLPDDLYQQLCRRELSAETDRYLETLIAEVGEPSPNETSRAEAVARRFRRRHAREPS